MAASHPHPPIVRWLFLPLLLGLGGGLVCGIAAIWDPRQQPLPSFAMGAGYGVGVGTALGIAQNLYLRWFLAAILSLPATSAALAMTGHMGAPAKDFLLLFLAFNLWPAIALPSALLAACHAGQERWGGRHRWAFLAAWAMTSLVLLLGGWILSRFMQGLHLRYFPCLGLGQAIGMSAALRLSRMLGPSCLGGIR